MISYDELAEIILESSSLKKEGIERSIESELKKVLHIPKPLTVITGIRRSGKSFILKRLYKELVEKEIPRENLLFINFENDRLRSLKYVEQLRAVYEIFIAEALPSKPVYLFFDEIQNIQDWEKLVRTIYDSTDHHIYITGSNARMLSKEFASTLGGRLLEYSLYPFSFKEMLLYKSIPFQNAFDRANSKKEIAKSMEEYLSYGGLPEIFDLPDEAKLTYRKSLIDKIVINDIASRYNLQSFELLNNLMAFLERNTGNIVSYRKMANVAMASEPTVEQYIAYLENAFIIEKLKKFSWKTKSIFDTNKKFYFVDNLFCHYANIEDKLENVCYQHLARKFGTQNIFLGRDDKQKEVDFIVKTPDNKMLAFQVCFELNDDNYKRETASLQLFEKYVSNQDAKSNIVYFNKTTRSELPQGIKAINIIEFLLL